MFAGRLTVMKARTRVEEEGEKKNQNKGKKNTESNGEWQGDKYREERVRALNLSLALKTRAVRRGRGEGSSKWCSVKINIGSIYWHPPGAICWVSFSHRHGKSRPSEVNKKKNSTLNFEIICLPTCLYTNEEFYWHNLSENKVLRLDLFIPVLSFIDTDVILQLWDEVWSMKALVSQRLHVVFLIMNQSALKMPTRHQRSSASQSLQKAYFKSRCTSGCVRMSECRSSSADIDECADGFVECDSKSTCVNLPGWYHCECRDGYHDNGLFSANGDSCVGELTAFIFTWP